MKILPVFLSALTTAEKFALSGEMLLKGLGTVFMVLVILWGILALFSVAFGTQSKTAKAPAVKSAQAPKPTPAKPAPAPVQTETPTAPAPVTPAAADDGALIAAITAAIEAYRAEEGTYALPFRVVSFKRKNGSSGWNGNSAEN